MNEPTLISIIITAYFVDKYVESCISAVFLLLGADESWFTDTK